MKKFILYAGVLLGTTIFYNLSDHWWYGKEWVFALLATILFAFFLQGWQRYTPNGAGLVFVTMYILLMFNSILMFQEMKIIFFSLLVGLLLIPLYRRHRDAVLTAWVFVLINIIVYMEFPTELALPIFFLVTGVAALVGMRLQSFLLKRFFTVCFFLFTGPWFLLTLGARSVYSLVIGGLIAAFAIGAYFISKKSTK